MVLSLVPPRIGTANTEPLTERWVAPTSGGRSVWCVRSCAQGVIGAGGSSDRERRGRGQVGGPWEHHLRRAALARSGAVAGARAALVDRL